MILIVMVVVVGAAKIICEHWAAPKLDASHSHHSHSIDAPKKHNFDVINAASRMFSSELWQLRLTLSLSLQRFAANLKICKWVITLVISGHCPHLSH